MAVSYRRGRVADAAALASFATRAFTDTYAEHNTADDMREYLASAYGAEHQARELEDSAMITMVAESENALLGFAQLRRSEAPPSVASDAPIEIYRFYVDRSAHGTGVAQQLMKETLAAARDLGANHVWLGVWEKNGRAIAFYRKSGFQDVGTQIFQLGADRQTDRVLVIPIA